MYTLIHNSQFRRSQSRPHAVSFFSTAYRRIGSTYREHVVNMLNQRRLPVQGDLFHSIPLKDHYILSMVNKRKISKLLNYSCFHRLKTMCFLPLAQISQLPLTGLSWWNKSGIFQESTSQPPRPLLWLQVLKVPRIGNLTALPPSCSRGGGMEIADRSKRA